MIPPDDNAMLDAREPWIAPWAEARCPCGHVIEVLGHGAMKTANDSLRLHQLACSNNEQ